MTRISQWLGSLLSREDGSDQETSSAGEGDIVQAGIEDGGLEAQVTVGVDSHRPCPEGVFEVGLRTDTGVVRDHNEDALYAFTGCPHGKGSAGAFGLFMVADGMGGHAAGEKASDLALRTAASHLIDTVYGPFSSGAERSAEQPAVGDLIRQAGELASAAVIRDWPGSGCTLTYGLVLGARLFVGHVGDSRAYLLRGEAAPRVLTQDHSFVRRLVEVGQLTEAEAAVHPRRNVLYRAVGQAEALEVDMVTLSLEPGDRLLLCSDGLWNMVGDSEIQSVITSAGDAQAACDRLVEAANAAGGEDNITALLVKMNIEV